MRRLHEWLQHQSVHEGAEEMERWVPPPTPPEKQAKAKSWLPVCKIGASFETKGVLLQSLSQKDPRGLEFWGLGFRVLGFRV